MEYFFQLKEYLFNATKHVKVHRHYPRVQQSPPYNHTCTISPSRRLNYFTQLFPCNPNFEASQQMADPKARAQLAGAMTATESWLRKHRLIYTGATRHPFILTIRDGTIDLSAFKTWLVSSQKFSNRLFENDQFLNQTKISGTGFRISEIFRCVRRKCFSESMERIRRSSRRGSHSCMFSSSKRRIRMV